MAGLGRQRQRTDATQPVRVRAPKRELAASSRALNILRVRFAAPLHPRLPL